MTLAVVSQRLAAACRSAAEQRAERIRGHLAASLTAAGLALEELAAARAEGDDAALGFAHWFEYVEWLTGDLRNLRLHNSAAAVAERVALEGSMRAAGMTYRPIAEKLGVSVGTIRNDLGAPRVAPVVMPAPTGPVWRQAVEWLQRHPDGLTLAELAKAAGWSEGAASGALSDVRRRGLAVRTEDRRNGMRVHLAVEVEA